MKFEYNKTVPIAWLYWMEPSVNTFNTDDLALCIITTDSEKFIWMYSDGDITVQTTKPEGEVLKTFYEGDSLTITFGTDK